MEDKILGDIIKHIRTKNGLSQEEACSGICDRRTYIRWEKNEVEPSVYNLNKLSYRFNCDLQAYYKMLICDKSPRAWLYKEKAEYYLTQKKWTKLITLLEEMEYFQEFREGENKQTILYYKSLYYTQYKKDYTQSIRICLEGLYVENKEYSIDKENSKIYSNVGLSLLNCLACNHNKIGKSDLANKIFINIINRIDNKIIKEMSYYQSIDFEKKLYQTTIYNLSLNLKRKQDYNKALNYITKGIDFSLQHNFLYCLADLFELKFKILYLQENYIEAKKAFNFCINLYLLNNNIKKYDDCISSLNNEFTKIK